MNEEKANMAEKYVEAHPDSGELELISIISDIIADLKHLADRENVDFDERLRVAEFNYQQECE